MKTPQKSVTLSEKKIHNLHKTNYADSCVLSSTSSTQQFNAEPDQGVKKSCISHPRAILPTSDTFSRCARKQSKDGVGGKRAAFATDWNRWKDAQRACTGYMWQHLMLLKDCCGGCLVLWLAPTHLRTWRQMHSYVRTYIRVSLFRPQGLSIFTLWAGRLCGLEKTTSVTQVTPTAGSRRRPDLSLSLVWFSCWSSGKRSLTRTWSLFPAAKASTHWPLEAIWRVKTQSRMISRKMAHLCLKVYRTKRRADRTQSG